MSKRTLTKQLRTLDYNPDASAVALRIGHRPEIREKVGALVKKEIPDPVTPRRHIGDCHICLLPVMVSPGQIINIGTTTHRDGSTSTVYAHKRCRKLKK